MYSEFKKHGLLGIETEAEKLIFLAALNLVECIANAALGKDAQGWPFAFPVKNL